MKFINLTSNFISFTVFVLLIQSILSKQTSSQEQTNKNIAKAVQYRFLVFTQKCFDKFFVTFDWFDFECLKLTISKCLGYGLVMGGTLIKFPQIIKIISAKSVVGISFASVILQVSTSILMSGYGIYKGNPFSLYGQNVFIGFQMVIIIALFLVWGKQNKAIYLIFLVIILVCGYLASDPHHIPSIVIEHSITVQTILICSSRLTQIIQTHRLKSVGNLALITYALTLVGNIARIGTIMVQASNDYKYLISMVCVAIINAYIVFQFYLYRQNKVKPEQKRQ